MYQFITLLVVQVSFAPESDSVVENELSQTVDVLINRNILRNLIVSVSGGKPRL